jgi:hypothetical protein
MDCKHDQYKCTDNRFFCIICGAEIADPFAVKEYTDRDEKPAEAPKKAAKRKTKKEAE